MQAQRKGRRGDLIPVIAVIVAAVGQAVILFNDFGPGSNTHGGVNARMITAAVGSKAGALEIPSAPTPGRPVSWAVDRAAMVDSATAKSVEELQAEIPRENATRPSPMS